MSIVIHGMKMPIIEMEWTIRHGADGKWYAIDANAETSDGEWHEIIPVPPHGDLIDRDKLRKKEFIHDGDAYAVVMSRDIRNAPTIIKAEDEDK